MRASVDRLVINRRAGPADFLGRFVFARADPVMLEKSRVLHKSQPADGPSVTVLNNRDRGRVARDFFLRGFEPPVPILVPILVTLQISANAEFPDHVLVLFYGKDGECAAPTRVKIICETDSSAPANL